MIWVLSTRDTYHITHSFAALTRSWNDMCHSLIKPISKCNPCNNLLLLHTYTVMRPDNAFSALYNNTEQRANIGHIYEYLPGYWVFARILRFGPLPVLRRREWSMGERRLQSTSDYYIVTSYLNAFNLLNYNDICLYRQYAILCQQNVSAIRWSY